VKKLFSLTAVFVLVFSLTACTTSGEDATRIATLEQQLSDLQDQLATLESENATLTANQADAAALQASIDELEAELDALREELYEVNMTVQAIALDGTVTERHFGFDEDDVPELTDLIVLAFDADVQDTQYGSYLAGLDGIDVPYGSYLAISENGEMTMVGIDDLTIDDGDTFTFEVVWWDTTQQAVYEAIQLFVENQLDEYLNTEFIDSNVLLACHAFCDMPITETDIETYLDDWTPTTVQDHFKAIQLARTLSDSTHLDALIASLLAIVEPGAFGQTGLGLIALDGTDHGQDDSAYLAQALSYYTSSTPFDEGLDAGAYGVIALSRHTDEEGVADLIDAYTEWVANDQLPSGGIRTRDIVWNDTTYPGTENAATMAQVILALVANGIDPASGDYVQGDSNLVLRLTQFQLDDGSFDWDLTDDIENDLMFSTPQAFLALVTYHRFMNSFGAYNSPYHD
jgi:cell division protein FtsB